MPSFSKMSTWNVGYFRGTSSWLLRNRRDIEARLAVINAEIARIGQVTVIYQVVESNGTYKVTENRVGFAVTENSSLERLIRAYVANGGNPLDISMFLHPDRTRILDVGEDGTPVFLDEYPYGGVVAPKSASYNSPVDDPADTGFGGYQGGYAEISRYYPARLGGRVDPGARDEETVVRAMQQIRGWANQEIMERLQDMEARIIKLCDLREQLEKERDEVLVAAFGGTLAALESFDDEQFVSDLLVQNMIQGMNELLYETEEGEVRSYRGNPKTVPLLDYTFEDLISELLLDVG